MPPSYTPLIALLAICMAMLISVPMTLVSAVASPLPVPESLYAADYSSRFPSIVQATHRKMIKRSHSSANHSEIRQKHSSLHSSHLGSIKESTTEHTVHAAAHRVFFRDDPTSDLDDLINQLSSQRDSVVSYSQDIRQFDSSFCTSPYRFFFRKSCTRISFEWWHGFFSTGRCCQINVIPNVDAKSRKSTCSAWCRQRIGQL